MTGLPIEALADIRNRDAVYQDVHEIIDDDNEPAGQPRWCVRMKPGFGTFGPGRAAWPWAIFQPCNMTRQVPAINDEMRTAHDSKRVDILSYEKKRQDVKGAVHERGERPFRFLEGHPLALQQVIANGVRD
jgi:hypothetical protein